MLYQKIKEFYAQPIGEKLAKKCRREFDERTDGVPPKADEPRLFKRLAEGLMEEGLERVDDECTATKCVLELNVI